MNNFDRIKNMTKEEFSEWWDKTIDCVDCPIGSNCDSTNCSKSVEKWLGEEIQ